MRVAKCRNATRPQIREMMKRGGFDEHRVSRELKEMELLQHAYAVTVNTSEGKFSLWNEARSDEPTRWRICSEHETPSGKSVAKSFFTSKPGLAITGVVAGYILGKIL